jgi:murein DD-endopeptidase MepM/ murein hydrolase activator NlpD
VSRGDVALALIAVGLIGLAATLSAPATPARGAVQPVLEVGPPAPHLETRTGRLASGETLGMLLGRVGATREEVSRWVEAAQQRLDLRALPVGLVAEAVVDGDGVLRAVRLLPDWRRAVLLEREGGDVVAREEAREVERALLVVRGIVSNSLFAAVTGAGHRDDLALELADVFQWDVDFSREVQPGDTFAVLVEEVRSGGRIVAYGPVLAATYVNAGREYQAVRFAATAAAPGHYDAAGRPIRKQFLRSPLRFSRLTSRYSASRLHPVLGRRVPHWGVDYAAPEGTPVMATGDGTVTFRGWREGQGNLAELSHPGGFTTAYLHLSRFSSAAVVGARVRQGEVIGFVGSTGLSTGPHVDYRVTQRGRHLNPLGIGRDPLPPLPAGELERFRAWATVALPLLSAAGALPPERVAALRAAAPVRLDG